MGAKYDLHSGGQGEYPQNYNFFQKVNKFNAYNKAFHPILGLYEVPSTVFAPGPLVV